MRLRIDLTQKQWLRISEILSNIGMASMTSVIIPAIFGSLNSGFIILGLVISIGFWYISIISAKRS